MRVLVIGATGYVGSRVCGALLAQGHEVCAAARDLQKLDQFWWSDRVERVQLDVQDAESVRGAFERARADAVVYLVHSMAGDDFQVTELASAQHVRAASDAAGVSRIVYLSGIIPPIDEAQLSEHLQSRLGVERELSRADAVVVTLRAAMVVGAGSTSFELMIQLTDRLPVTVVPEWMHRDVEPVAVSDVVRAVVAALTWSGVTTHFDVGGGERLPYPELTDLVARARGTERPQITVPLLPEKLVAKIGSWLSDIPSSTVTALMESLREDMVAADDRWRSELFAAALGGEAVASVTLAESVERALAETQYHLPPSQRDVLGALPGDPPWAS